jgi:sirohydrochlorin cobaltochelatase
MREQGQSPGQLPLAVTFAFGQVLIQPVGEGKFQLYHRDDTETVDRLQVYQNPEHALEIARLDDAGLYRPLKTAPNLRHGWRLDIASVADLRRALDYFYPGRSAMLARWVRHDLPVTPLRDTLNRQSGMYRVAAVISDDQVNGVVADFCRSDGGCLRAILWKRDAHRGPASTKLPPQKFDPGYDQALASGTTAAVPVHVPLLCQEACNLLVAECRKRVKGN